MLEIVSPTPPVPSTGDQPAVAMRGGVTGKLVGLRLDNNWRSFFPVVDVWEDLLVADGARVHRVVTGERTGPHAAQTRADIDQWSRLVEVGVVGLGN